MSKEECIARLKGPGDSILADFPMYQDDDEVVMEAVKAKAFNLRYASDRLKANREIVMIAVQSQGECLEFASDGLKRDKGIVMAALTSPRIDDYYSYGTNLIDHVSRTLWSDKDVMLAAVKLDGNNLNLVSDALKGDEDVVTAAVRENGHALSYADYKFLYRRDICLLSCITFPSAVALTNYRTDRPFLLEAVALNGFVLKYALYELRDDLTIVTTAIKQDASALKYASDRLKDDEGVVLLAVSDRGYTLEYASPRLQQSKHIVMTALACTDNEVSTIDVIPPMFKDDLDVIMTAYKLSKIPALVHDDGVEEYHDFDVYAFASLRCKQDLELIQLCYKEEGSEFLEEIVKEAWEKPDVLEWACTLPMDEIPVEHRDKLIALNKLRVVAKNTSIPDKGVKTPSRQNPATDQYPEGRFSDITSAHGLNAKTMKHVASFLGGRQRKTRRKKISFSNNGCKTQCNKTSRKKRNGS